MSTTISSDAEAREHIKISPASFNQEELWILDQIEQGRSFNTLTATVRIPATLTSLTLQAALDTLLRRHEVLRTTFRLQEDQLTQVIAPETTIPLSLYNLRSLAPQDQGVQIALFTRQLELPPFSFEQGPLLRCALLLLDSQSSLFLLCLHRLIADDWALALLLRELASLCLDPLSLPPPTVQYADFARRQRDALTPQVLEPLLDYWRQVLVDAPPAIALPTDHPRPALPRLQAATLQTLLSANSTQALLDFSRQYGVSLSTALFAICSTLLARFTGQDDLLLGTLAPARFSEQEQAVLGPCDNTLLLRPNLEGDPSFLHLLTRLDSLLQEALAHATLPFSTLLKALYPTHSLSSAPLFQVQLLLPWSLPALPEGWQLLPLETGDQMTPFDLILQLQQSAEGLSCRCTYRTELFEAETIMRLLTHWQILLEGILATPDLPLSQLPLLSEAERQLLLETWTQTQRDLPLHRSFSALFQEQVRRYPLAIAVSCQGEQLTYQALNEQANSLAHQLQERGVGPECLVALLGERGIPLLIAILAVFKAGGAYLPLDPHHPQARLSHVLEQSQCSLLLSTSALVTLAAQAVEALPTAQRPAYEDLEALLAAPLKRAEYVEDLSEVGNGQSLAYVIYTSGSTGRPKGAMVERAGMLNHLFAKIEALQLDAQDIVAQTASQCFDISVWQFLAALLVGGRVQIYPDDIAHDPAQLLLHVQRQQVSILETVPSLMSALLETFQDRPQERPPLHALRWLIPTGEALPVELCRVWLQTYPHIPLLNAYGPTECSDDVTHAVIAEPPAAGVSSIPIGHAIANMRLYVLDRARQPVPIGVRGELYVGGIGVGRGYLGDEARTREVFVPDPFSRQEGARLYRTGDLGRYLADGSLEFQGRIDFQVKLRGFRIELGEIEAILNQLPGVQQAVVLVREDVPGDKRLVAYVLAQPEEDLRPEELKRQVQQQVPDYMVPVAFVLLEQWLVTTNGKLDRAGLPIPEFNRQEERYVAPVTVLECQLVAIWEELLGVQPIGLQDDFFALGGDSLRAVRLFDRIAQVCGKKLALSTLFAGATIEQLASALEQKLPLVQAEETRTPLVVVQAQGARRPFFFLHGEWRGGALYTGEVSRMLGPEQPFYLLEPYRFTGLAVPPALEEMAAAHLQVMRRVQPEGPYLLGGYCNGGLIAYEMARQLHAQGQSVALLLLIDPDAPARHRWVHQAIDRFCSAMSIDQQKQFETFLCLQHLYRYIRFSHYRQAKISELLGIVEQHKPVHKVRKSVSVPLHLKWKALLPNVETLRQENLNLYDWSASDYAPDLYSGKITFFWTSEEPWRPVGWQKVVEAKRGAVEIHMLPGNHITSRTEYLPVLAERFSDCVNEAQKTH
jgi:amino acid adenylation domain-containing protein